MSVITTRSGKGSALTSAEVDANFTNLNSDKAEKSITISAGTGLTGGGDLSGNRTLGLATSGVSPATYGGNNSIPTLAIDAYGRVTGAGSIVPSGTWNHSISGNAATVSSITSSQVTTALGFTPVQQSGGVGQSTNKIYIGWSATGLKATVDVTDQGVFLLSSNYNSYAPTLTGTGASGTWGISITGNAATVSSITSTQVTSALGYAPPWPTGAGASGTWGISITGNAATVSSITSGQVTGALGFTPVQQSGGVGQSTNKIYIGWSASGLKATVDITDQGVFLLSSNYNSYAPTLTGGGASSTWGINVTGNAATVTNGVYTAGNQTINGVKTFTSTLSASIDGNAATVGGFGIANIPSGNNAAATSDTISNMNDLAQKSGFYVRDNPTNAPEATWNTWMTAMGHYVGDRYGWQLSQAYWSDALWTRRLTSNVWQPWRKILDSGNYNSYSPTLTGGGASGTWNIAINGNAGTATALQNVRSINGVNFNGTANITIRNFSGSGNEYNALGLEVSGNGTSLPGVGFHQPGQFAGSMLMTSSTTFGIYQQGSAAYGDLNLRNALAVNDVRAPTFYNINDTRYYQSFGDSHRFGSHNGWIDIGPKNDGTCHMYSDLPSFYFNKHLLFNGKRILNADEWINGKYYSSDGATYANIFYDGNNSNYYCDPTGSSRFAGLVVGNGAHCYITLTDDESTSGNKSVHANGNVIGFLNGGGGWCVYFDHNGNGTMGGTLSQNSDERLKKDWGVLPSDFIEQLATVKYGTYSFIDAEGGSRQAGASAQDMQRILPEVVTENLDGMLSLGYGNAALVSSIALAQRIVELERRLGALES